MIKEKLISISELTKLIGLINKKNNKPATHILRFWETKFTQLKPTILSGNRRYYTKKDTETVMLIKYLLKEKGFTIKGAKKILKQNINTLDDYNTSSIKALYLKKNIKFKTENLLNKLKKLKANGKKNSR
jgi:DNA-binding transcriptional MerR regulator